MELSMSDLRELLWPANEPATQTVPATIKIVVLQRGWVVVGWYQRIGDEIVVTGASTIRRWGTTAGLGEIAEKGPLPNTKLDKCGTVRAPFIGVVHAIDCDQSKWREQCN